MLLALAMFVTFVTSFVKPKMPLPYIGQDTIEIEVFYSSFRTGEFI